MNRFRCHLAEVVALSSSGDCGATFPLGLTGGVAVVNVHRSGSKNRFPPGAPTAILVKKKIFFAVIFVNILCGKSYFDKKSVSIFFHILTSKLWFEAPRTTFLDRLDTISGAIDATNTLVALF